MDLNKIFDVKCNGKLKHGENFKTPVHIETIENPNQLNPSDVDEFTSAENAIFFAVEDCPPEIKISTEIPFKIKILSIVITNCNKIEVYTDKFEQYLRTIYGDILDDMDGIKTFSFTLNLDVLVDHITLKLVTGSTEFWIYGINLKVLNTLDISNPHSSINLQNVQKMLEESNVKLSENAKKCQTFLQTYIQSTDPMTQVQMNPPVITDIVRQSIKETVETKFAKIFDEEIKKFICANQPSTSSSSSDTFSMEAMKNSLASEKPSLQSMLDNLPPPRPRPTMEEMMAMISKQTAPVNSQMSPVEEIKSVVHEEIQHLERNIYQKLDDIERKQDEKLNEILKKLDDYNKTTQ